MIKLAIKSVWFDLESYSNVESCAKNLVVEAVEHVPSQKPMQERIPDWTNSELNEFVCKVKLHSTNHKR